MHRKATHIASEIAPFHVGETFKWQSQSEAKSTEQPISNDRRSFLAILTGLIGVGITSFLGVTLGRYSIAPALAAANVSDWVDAGPLRAIPEDKPKNLKVLVSQNAGWGNFTSEQSVWVTRKGEQLAVFTSVCPHLGCTINENLNGFGCACHNSAWTRDGEKSGGPAPRGMDRLEHKVEDGILKVKYQTFKQGLTEKVIAS
jgi:Rieske Fe-S protein